MAELAEGAWDRISICFDPLDEIKGTGVTVVVANSGKVPPTSSLHAPPSFVRLCVLRCGMFILLRRPVFIGSHLILRVAEV